MDIDVIWDAEDGISIYDIYHIYEELNLMINSWIN